MLTTQKLHSTIQNATGNLSSKYVPSQKINRRGYDVSTMFKGIYLISPDYSNNQTAQDMVEILESAGIESEIKKDVVIVKRNQ